MIEGVSATMRPLSVSITFHFSVVTLHFSVVTLHFSSVTLHFSGFILAASSFMLAEFLGEGTDILPLFCAFDFRMGKEPHPYTLAAYF